MGERPIAEDGFGARFLATYREVGGIPSVFNYATLLAIQAAAREGLDELLRRSLTLPYRVLGMCASATPEELAREVVDELRRQSAGAIVLLLALGMGL